jgi:hypothetical protein
MRTKCEMAVRGPAARGHRTQVAAEAKLTAGPGQHDSADGWITAAGHGSRQQVHRDLEVQRVGAIRTIQGDERNCALGFDLDAGSGHAATFLV